MTVLKGIIIIYILTWKDLQVILNEKSQLQNSIFDPIFIKNKIMYIYVK